MNEQRASASPNMRTPPEDFRLSQQQVAYFRTFGFLVLPRLFAADVERLRDGFDEIFAQTEPDIVLRDDPLQQTDNTTFADKRRAIITPFIERSSKLRWLETDPRVLGVVRSIVGERYRTEPTDGHVFDCDTSWHRDFYLDKRDDPFRLKLSFYLDSQHANSGAIRVIPGSSHYESSYARTLVKNLYGHPSRVKENYGVEADEIPCWMIESEPGDLICWDYRTIHASFHGFNRRRLFSMTFRHVVENDDAEGRST